MGLEEFKSLTEIVSERSYTRKVYDLGKGSKRYRFHTAHKHYKGSAIDGFAFKEIDTTLIWDDTNKVWHQEKASYHSDIPEYADGEFDFFNCYEGANHHIKARPVADHVKGVLTNGAEDGNFVLYKDAFGKGIDLKVYAYHHGLKKVIIVNEKPTELKDLTFKFELTDLSAIDFKAKDDTVINVSLMSANYDFKDKTIKIGKDGKYSYFRNAWMWDSSTPLNSEPVKIHIEKSGSKAFIVKTVTKEFLEKATFPVMTDHPTSYYAGAGDGYCQKSSHYTNGWDTVHNATSANIVDYTNPQGGIGTGINMGAEYFISRMFFPIDTSGIDDGVTITEAILKIYISIKINNENDGNDYINIVQTSQSSTSELVGNDFDNCGDVHIPTLGMDTSIDFSEISTNGYLNITLNSTGRGWIDKAGYTKLGLREGHDIADDPVALAVQQNFLAAATSEDTTAAQGEVGCQDPYLDVTVSAVETIIGPFPTFRPDLI